MIYAWDNYPERQFPGLWDWMAIQVREKKLRMPSVAFDEVVAKTPDCGKWLKANGLEQLKITDVIVQDAMRIKGLLSIRDDNYHPKGVGENDLFIVATARAHRADLVSDEERQRNLPKVASKRKIPAVCDMHEVAVRCINFIEYLRGSDVVFR